MIVRWIEEVIDEVAQALPDGNDGPKRRQNAL